MTVRVEIGINSYDVPVPSFRLLKQAWPHIEAMQSSGDLMDKASHALSIVSIFLSKDHPSVTPDYIEDNLESRQIKQLVNSLPQILIEAGLMTPTGEAQAPEANH